MKVGERMLYQAAIAGCGIGLCLGFALGVYVGYTASWAHFVRKYVSEPSENSGG